MHPEPPQQQSAGVTCPGRLHLQRACGHLPAAARWRAVHSLRVLLVVFCALACPVGVVLAQSDAFTVEVAVAERSPEERADAYARGLRQVLLSNSGDKTLMNRDDVREAIRVAEDYVETYRFRTPEPGTLIPPETPVSQRVRDTGEATGLLLVRFDRLRVLSLIAGKTGDRDPGESELDANVTPFANVDQALVWLLIDDGQRAVKGSDAAATKVRDRLRELAGGAGASLVFPVDEQSQSDQGLSDEALRSQDIQQIRAASLRYAIDVVLTGHISRAIAPALGLDAEPDAEADVSAIGSRVRRESSPGRAPRTGSRETAGGWVGEWTQSVGDVSETTRTTGASLDDVLRSGIAWLVSDASLEAPVDYEYGGTGSSAEGLVRIDGIDSLGDYAELSRLLAEVPGVANSWPRELSGNVAVFAVVPRSALSAVSTALDRSGWLRRGVASADATQSAIARSVELVYDVVR